MKTTRPTFGAFNQGGVPTIACFNKATDPLGVDFDALIAAMQAYVDQHVVPVWNTPAKLVKTKDFVKKAWAMVFLDDSDQPGGPRVSRPYARRPAPFEGVREDDDQERRPSQRVRVPRAGRDAGRPGHQHDDHGPRSEDHLRLRKRRSR